MKNLIKIVISLNLVSQSALAVIPGEQKELDPSKVPAVVATEPFVTYQDVARVIPTDMPSHSTEAEITKRIADQGMDVIFNSNVVKKSNIGKAAQALNLDANITIGSKEDKGIEHKLAMRVYALQSIARFEYTGFLHANATFSASSKNVDLNINENITDSSRLVVNHKTTDQVSSVTMQWDW